MQIDHTVTSFTGKPWEGWIFWAFFIFSFLLVIGAGLVWLEWSLPACFLACTLLVYRYHRTSGFSINLIVLSLLFSGFLHLKIESIKQNAQRDAYDAHRAAIGCADSDTYLAFGEDPKALGGRPIPPKDVLERCRGDEDDDSAY